MEEIKYKLQNIKQKLLESKKEKLLCVSTTANLNNPQVFIGGIRETNSTIAGNIILRDTAIVDYVINEFDGFVDYFLIDCEVKNELKNLEQEIVPKIKKSKFLIYKPNDFTVNSLDLFISLLFISLQDKNILIMGAGNIGSKIGLSLCERGANVYFFSKNLEKTRKISEGLNLIKSSIKEIKVIEDISNDGILFDIVLGCTPGIPIINENIIKNLNNNSKIIDVGNGTISKIGLEEAKKNNIEIFILSSFSGYLGMIENWINQRNFFSKDRFISFGDTNIIIPGILGNKGDIIVNDIKNPTKIIGICDGNGDILSIQEQNSILKDFFGKFISDPYILKLMEICAMI